MSFTIQEMPAGYLLFTINNMEKRNAINFEVMDGLQEAIIRAKTSRVKALVITGSGEKAFCSGGDLSVFHRLKTEQEAFDMLKKMADILYELLTLPIPTVALMNGAAVGGGCELAAACDFRIAREDIIAGFIQGNQAITTGWGGGTIVTEKFLPATGLKLLADAAIHKAETLKEIGFVNELYTGDGLAFCEIFLKDLLRKETVVLEAYKRLYIRKWEQNGVRQRMEEEVRMCSILWEGEAHHTYVNQFLSKKKS